MPATGTVVFDFGLGYTQDVLSVDVTGQAGLLVNDHVEAFVMREASADHTEADAEMLANFGKFWCKVITAGSTFRIYGCVNGALTWGRYNVRWVYAT